MNDSARATYKDPHVSMSSGGGFAAGLTPADLKRDAEFGRRLRSLAETGTAENFLSCDDETKRGIFALAVEESSRRKEAEARIEEMLEALHKASDFLAVISQTPGGTWFVQADDPETAVCDTDAAIQAAIAKAEASPAPAEDAGR